MTEETKCAANKLLPDQEGRVVGFTDEGLAAKLMGMGCIPGSTLRLVRNAPFGGGCYVKVDNLLLALRAVEMEGIIVVPRPCEITTELSR